MFKFAVLKKLLPVFGALLLFGLALLFRTLDVAPHGAPTDTATCTAGIRGVIGTEASA